ncbi:MAG TPA: hypothetical protein VHR67_09360, partial [Aestuariivirgaceae bacterium]|nr:hypothetical protein [Aestuariivirgaceae bacterium]
MFLPNWSIKGEYQYIGLRHGPVASATEFVGGLGTAFVITHVNPPIAMHKRSHRPQLPLHSGSAGSGRRTLLSEANLKRSGPAKCRAFSFELGEQLD